jgi:branched-chain amino acid transport system permease protein
VSYLLHLLVYFQVFALVALSLNLVVGYCGLLSLAHAGYFAIGGYAYALISLKTGLGFPLAALVGALLAAILSLAVSLPSWRLKGDFFVLVSLAVQALIFSVLHNWTSLDAPVGSWGNLTNGPFGIAAIPRPAVGSLQMSTAVAMAGFATVVTLILGVLLWRLGRSPWARLLVAMREDELAARGLGKNTRLAKVQAIALASSVAAVAGSLYAGHVRFLDPSSASLNESILFLSMVLVGGAGNFRGPLIGAFVLVSLPEVLRLLALPAAQAANLRLLVYGLLLILFVHFRPQGIAGEYRVE